LNTPSPGARFLLLAVVALLFASAASAADADPAPQLDLYTRRDFIRHGAEIGGLAAFSIWATNRLPAACRWCDGAPTSLDGLNRFDKWGHGARLETSAHRDHADTVSTMTEYVAAAGPSAVPYLRRIFRRGLDRQANTEALVVIQAVMTEVAVSSAIKSLAGRERPYGHTLTPGDLAAAPRDVNGSFYSGHTGTAFAGLFAYARVRKMRATTSSTEFRSTAMPKTWWWAALPAAAVTPYLRMAADQHYLTDVITGAVVGSAIGWYVPVLLRSHTGDVITLAPITGSSGTGLAGSIRW